LVVGGSSGIGLAIARMLAEEGYALTLAGRRVERLGAAAESLSPHPCHLVAGDVTDPDFAAVIVSDHLQMFGRLDVLVNSAGVGHLANVGDVEDFRYRKQMATNFTGAVAMTHAAADALRAAAAPSGRALVVYVSSIAAKTPFAGQSIYSATKAALSGWCEAIGPDLRRDRVAVLTLHPDLVETPMTGWLADMVDPSTMLRPSDIAEAVRLVLRLGPNCDVRELTLICRSTAALPLASGA
jgi:NAD(P)-dependent dehydrogenase (short-subunit alcohol dehydrogenase family)